jgi:hypothetical protein
MARHLCTYVALAVHTGSPVGTLQSLAARRVVELKERCAAILRMQLVALVVFPVDVLDKAHAERLRP